MADLPDNHSAPPLPDELGATISQYKAQSKTTASEIALRTLVSTIPYAGAPILEIANGFAQRRVQGRLNEVFDAMKERLDAVTEEKVDKEYFNSEEFQTLLYLLLERLHTTHDKKKLRMFGNALGNAGLLEFRAEDKEHFVRVLRDLSLSELQVLDDSRLKSWFPHIPGRDIQYANEILEKLFRLQAMGLVLSRIVSGQPAPGPPPNVSSDPPFVSESFWKPEKPHFYLSDFGTRFLGFLKGGGRD